MLVSGRGPSSTSTVVRLLRPLATTGVISSAKLPSDVAAAALWLLLIANSSCSSRVTSNSVAVPSASVPMCVSLNEHVRPSWIIESAIFQSPRRRPNRLPSSMWGARLMFSIPPATTMSASPDRTIISASTTAIMPDAHTLFTVSADEPSGSPAPIAACRAGAWPRPAESTFPMIV